MKKATRFDAAAKGILQKAALKIRRGQVTNSIERTRLNAQDEVESKTEELNNLVAEIANCPHAQIGTVLTRIADAMAARDEALARIEMADKIAAYLDEEIELPEEDKK